MPFKSRNSFFILAVLIIAATVITYSNHFNNAFHFDDSHSVENNAWIRDIHNIPTFFKDGTTASVLPQNQAYRPVVVTSLAIDYWLGNGYNLFYFHLSTFVLFLLQGLLMLYFFKRILQSSGFATAANYIAIVAVAWYLLHPANAETINYVIARSDVQSTFFVVAAFAMYVSSAVCQKWSLYLVPVFIGALAKPTAVMFAPMLLFYVLLMEEQLSLSSIFKKTYFSKTWAAIKKTIPSFVVCAIMYVLVDKLTPKNWEPGGTSPLQYLITQPYVITYYFKTFFLPNHLSADSDWTLLPGIWDIRFFVGLLFIGLMIAAAFIASRRQAWRPVSFGIIWFLLALVPSSSIVPLAEVVNDHRMFFPFVGLVLSVCCSAYLLLKRYTSVFVSKASKPIVAISICLLLAAYAYATFQRNEVWRTEESLWYDVTIKSPNNGRGLMNYGLAKMAKGEFADAEKYFKDALTLVPNYPLLYINMGVLKEATGNIAEAESNFTKGVALSNNSADAYYFYGRFLYNRHRYADALLALNKAIEISPAHMASRELLMNIYQDTGDWEQLKKMAEATLAVSPGNSAALQYLQSSTTKKSKLDLQFEEIRKAPSAEKYLDVSLAFFQAGSYQDCITAANEALKLKPRYAEAYNNIGSAYNALKKFKEAIDPLQKAIEINPGFELAKNNLAYAQRSINAMKDAQQAASTKPTAESYLNLSLSYFNNGMYAECIVACDKALAINPAYDLAYNNKCAAYNELKQWDNAIAVGKKGLEINKNNQILRNNLQVALNAKNNALNK